MLPEIKRLLDSHAELRKGSKGPDPHNTILKSSVVFLCAAWEYYCENLALEAAKKIADATFDPMDLPDAIRWQLNLSVHHAEVGKANSIKLAGNGWKEVYVDLVCQFCDQLNTPKAKPLNELFKKCLGIRDISGNWTVGHGDIDKFVTLRGDIAHKGSDADRVNREQAAHFLTIVGKTISDTDDAVYDYLRSSKMLGKAPWRRSK